MKSTFSTIFYLKRLAVKKDGTVPIMGRITVDGTQTQFSCKLNIQRDGQQDAAQWRWKQTACSTRCG